MPLKGFMARIGDDVRLSYVAAVVSQKTSFSQPLLSIIIVIYAIVRVIVAIRFPVRLDIAMISAISARLPPHVRPLVVKFVLVVTSSVIFPTRLVPVRKSVTLTKLKDGIGVSVSVIKCFIPVSQSPIPTSRLRASCGLANPQISRKSFLTAKLPRLVDGTLTVLALKSLSFSPNIPKTFKSYLIPLKGVTISVITSEFRVAFSRKISANANRSKLPFSVSVTVRITDKLPLARVFEVKIKSSVLGLLTWVNILFYQTSFKLARIRTTPRIKLTSLDLKNV